MKTNNPIIDGIIDAQSNAMNTWIDSAKKFQSAFTNGNPIAETQSIYKDMMDKQTAFFNGINNNMGSFGFNNDYTKPEEFFKNWYSQQLTNMKQMADFSQSIYNSALNYGKNAQDINSSFATMNNAWTNIYNSWTKTINASYDTFSQNMKNPFNADMFKNLQEGSQLFMKAQELFQPMINAIKNSDFSADTWKNIYSADNYKKMTEQVFGTFFSANNLKDVYENGMKQAQTFFINQNGLGKEYYAQMQSMSAQFPEMFSGNAEQLKDLYAKMNNVFGKTFEPLLKLANPGKEKENVEATIALMDKVAEFSVKQSELQSHLYKTMEAALENLSKETFEKYKNLTPGSYTVPTTQELYAEWIKNNEKIFSDLFASDEFSKVKADALNLSLDVKKHFEKQFQNVFEHYPIMFKSEMEEVYKTIHDLKKTVKELQTKLAMQNAASVELFDDEKTAKAKKK